MPKSSFQEIILKLQDFWVSHGCLIAQPYYTQVGAGTMNPATFLRVLGPEPWNVAYVEPSVRPDDGRYGENPNRFQVHYQFQVILKPDPGNPQELYIDSLKAIGIDPRQHDIRFVEDNWEQPAIAAWGLGWEVWLDGQEITQFTYFQQVGGVTLDPVAVELTYGLERILIALNNAKAIWDEPWGAGVTYGEIRRQEEFEHSKYYFEIADVARVRQMYELYRAEAEACLAGGLVLPAHDYVLKCSHAFNALDARGAIGVTERQAFFGQMRGLAKRVALAYLEQRKGLEYPLLKEEIHDSRRSTASHTRISKIELSKPASFLLEIGTEEIPANDVDGAHQQLTERIPALLDELHLEHGEVRIFSTPRRLAVFVEALSPRQPDRDELVKGPPADKAFDPDGIATSAALGFARGKGVHVKDLQVREMDGGKYVVAVVRQVGRPTLEVLEEILPGLIGGIRFEKSMRWNDSGVAFSRPIRWLVALLGETIVAFEYAGIASGDVTRGLRPFGSPETKVKSADKYFELLREAGIVLDGEQRKASILEQVKRAAASVRGEAILDEALLAEVSNLIEKPTAVLGGFDREFLSLPREVLISVMKKHQRYFPVQRPGATLSENSVTTSGEAPGQSAAQPRPGGWPLQPYFVAIRNGDSEHLDIVREGNEHVLGARFADAAFFVREDLKRKLEDFRPKLAGVIFQAKLGSMLDKSERMLKLAERLVRMLGLDEAEAIYARRATYLAKADLVTHMVTEMTSLQGIIGREYALRSGEAQPVADAIGEQYRPVPKTKAGLVVALADRLDSLVGLFAAGLAPTGAKDPFALRRAAIGTVQSLIEHDLAFDLRAGVESAASLQPGGLVPPVRTESPPGTPAGPMPEGQPASVGEGANAQLLDFLSGRLRVVLMDMGYRYDVVDAVLSAHSHNPAGAARAAKQLQAWVERPDWNVVLPAFARCVRITRDQKVRHAVRPEAFAEDAERALYKAINRQPPITNGDVDMFLNSVVDMTQAINTFFDNVLVMAEDKTVRENRLGLVQQVAGLAEGVADLSKLEGF
jgi:glycyl-tRNA synthetase